MTGFRIAIKDYREKSDPSGRVKLARIKPKIPGRTTKSLFAEADREAAKWTEPAEHYTPIPAKETDQ